MVGCDGYAGVTRDCLGAAYVGTADPRPNYNVVFRAPELDTPLGPAVQYWTVAAATPGLIGRLDLDGTWWAIMPGVPADHGAAHAASLITGLVGAPVAHELLASDPWTARVLVADRFCSRRVFLAGESAHVNPPYGGHGYNTSIGDAVNIAWKLAFVLRGWAGPRLLESYEPERRGVVEETVASAAANMRTLPADLARGRGGHQAREGAGVLQPRAGARLPLRGIAGGASGRQRVRCHRCRCLYAVGRAGRPPAALLAAGRFVAV